MAETLPPPSGQPGPDPNRLHDQLDDAIALMAMNAKQQGAIINGLMGGRGGGGPPPQRQHTGSPVYHKAPEIKSGIHTPNGRQTLYINSSMYNPDASSAATGAPPAARPVPPHRTPNYLPWGPNMIRRGREMATDPTSSKKRILGGVALATAGVFVSAATIPSPASSPMGGWRLSSGVHPNRRIDNSAHGRTPAHHTYDFLNPNAPTMPGARNGRVRRAARSVGRTLTRGMNTIIGRP